MKRFVGLCLSLMIVLSATTLKAQSSKTPVQFNDELTLITDSLYAYGQHWGVQFNEVNKSRSSEVTYPKAFSSLKPQRQAMGLFLDRSIARLRVMKDVKNSKDLRVAMITFLQYEKKMITEAFMPLEQLKSTATSDDLQSVYNKLQEYSKAENAELQKVVVAQQAYAASNGFTIEQAKEGEKP